MVHHSAQLKLKYRVALGIDTTYFNSLDRKWINNEPISHAIQRCREILPAGGSTLNAPSLMLWKLRPAFDDLFHQA